MHLIGMSTDTIVNSLADTALYKLITWLSPNFPVGAFTYSHGLEFAVEMNQVSDYDGLTHWVDGILRFGSGRVDSSFFRAAYEAQSSCDMTALSLIMERAYAQRGSAELILESTTQGRAFIDTLVKVWPEARLQAWHDRLAVDRCEPPYPIAVAVAAAIAAVPLEAALITYLHSFASNLVSAGLRLIPLGQTDGQRAMAHLEHRIIDSARAAVVRDPEDFGAAAVMVDWMSMQHETQYTRLFRS